MSASTFDGSGFRHSYSRSYKARKSVNVTELESGVRRRVAGDYLNFDTAINLKSCTEDRYVLHKVRELPGIPQLCEAW